jgi:hypothetical protein
MWRHVDDALQRTIADQTFLCWVLDEPQSRGQRIKATVPRAAQLDWPRKVANRVSEAV